jgi:hypothetical protein
LGDTKGVDDHALIEAAALEAAVSVSVSVPVRPIAGTVLGFRHGFELAARDGVWAAVAECGPFSVTVEGRGPPPDRLDLLQPD